MELPDLPKKKKRREADITPLVLRWFEDNYHKSCAIEIKVGKNKILPHQLAALAQVHGGTFSHKLPDMGNRNPFDAFLLINAKALLVTCQGMECVAVEPDGKSFEFKISKKKKPQ